MSCGTFFGLISRTSGFSQKTLRVITRRGIRNSSCVPVLRESTERGANFTHEKSPVEGLMLDWAGDAYNGMDQNSIQNTPWACQQRTAQIETVEQYYPPARAPFWQVEDCLSHDAPA